MVHFSAFYFGMLHYIPVLTLVRFFARRLAHFYFDYERISQFILLQDLVELSPSKIIYQEWYLFLKLSWDAPSLKAVMTRKSTASRYCWLVLVGWLKPAGHIIAFLFYQHPRPWLPETCATLCLILVWQLSKLNPKAIK